MVQSVLDVYNAALSACHAKGRLSSLSEQAKERIECDTWYPMVVKTVQEAAFWPSSQTLEYLSLQGTRDTNINWVETDPMPEFKYKYDLPENCLRPWYLTTYARFDLIFDAEEQGILLHTNQANAALVYAKFQNNPTFWSPSQQMATIYGLAAHIAGVLTGRGEIVQKNITLANKLLEDAQARSHKHSNNSRNVLPPSLAARGYDDIHFDQYKYFYPLGGVFSLGETQV